MMLANKIIELNAQIAARDATIAETEQDRTNRALFTTPLGDSNDNYLHPTSMEQISKALSDIYELVVKLQVENKSQAEQLENLLDLRTTDQASYQATEFMLEQLSDKFEKELQGVKYWGHSENWYADGAGAQEDDDQQEEQHQDEDGSQQGDEDEEKSSNAQKQENGAAQDAPPPSEQTAVVAVPSVFQPTDGLRAEATQFVPKPPIPRAIKLQAIPKADKYRDWREKLRDQVATASHRPRDAFDWIPEVEKAKSIDVLGDPGVGTLGSWETLDSALYEALQIPKSGEIERQIRALRKQLTTKAGKPVLLTGRQILYLIDEHMALDDLDIDILEVEKLKSIKMANNDLKRYVDTFETTLGEMAPHNVPT